MKQSEITKLATSDLKEQLVSLKKSYSELKMSHCVTPLENPLQLRVLRRSVARVATEITKRELQ